MNPAGPLSVVRAGVLECEVMAAAQSVGAVGDSGPVLANSQTHRGVLNHGYG
jgi:hypothetical protein